MAGHNEHNESAAKDITSNCTEVCNSVSRGKSSSKICLANVYVRGHPETAVKAYVVIDDQSNCSLGKSELFNRLNIKSSTSTYSLQTCAGTSQIQGRCLKGLVGESIDGSNRHQLSNVIDCNAIPDSKDEIPLPEVARAHPHLRGMAEIMLKICDDVDILFLVRRDAPPLQKIHESRNGSKKVPYAQCLDLGWVIIGNACLDGAHKPELSYHNRHILKNGRPSILTPCPNRFYIKENVSDPPDNEVHQTKETFKNGKFDDGLEQKYLQAQKTTTSLVNPWRIKDSSD